MMQHYDMNQHKVLSTFSNISTFLLFIHYVN